MRPTYVLVTPARNEAAFLEQTISSVVAQTIRPLKWIIVNDGSTDSTGEIVRRHAATHEWIELISMPPRTDRHFAGKARAFNEGYSRFRGLEFDVVGSLDADITFEPDYFAFLLERFANDSRLGVAGTPFREGTDQYDYRFTRKEHVSGACQLFRHACFESIGGYTPIPGGGVDLVAVITARMNGWRTETFTEKYCLHHRPMGTAKHHPLGKIFRDGYYDYPLGVRPLYKIVSCAYRVTQKPYLIGAIVHAGGYIWAMLRRPKTPVTPAFIRFRYTEQMHWLRAYLRKFLRLESSLPR